MSDDTMCSMTGKVCLVTGATSGIGRAAAGALAQQNATVVILSRNPKKCAQVAAEMQSATGNRDIGFIAADLSSLAAARAAAAEFRQRYTRLDVLLNNAGVSPSKRRESVDGFEYTFALNHLGHFLLTNLLLDLLIASAPSRIVSTSSSIYRQAKLDFDDLQLRRKFSAMRAYANSKLAGILFTVELARRLTDKGVTVNVMAPGLVKTNIGQEEGRLYASSKRMADFFGGKTPEQGADTLVWLATAPEVVGVTGQYFEKRKALPLSRDAADLELAARMWRVSEELCGLPKEGA
jgi:NAD(P)-dependent dehydrogenase (short-subunit alcohol dehydrogenase family)